MRAWRLKSATIRCMNLLSLILVLMAIIVSGCVFYVAWELSSGRSEEEETTEDTTDEGKEPGESKESKDSPGP